MSFISTKNIKGDLFGGITAGIVALPLALAFGIQAFGGINDPSASSVGALAGLVGATLLGCFALIFGGTHSQISGPNGPNDRNHRIGGERRMGSQQWQHERGAAHHVAGRHVLRFVPNLVWYH